MTTTLTAIETLPRAEIEAWEAMGRVIRILGSTLEPGDLAARIRLAMGDELGHDDCAVCLLDLQNGLVRRLDPSVVPDSLELRWPASAELLELLRTGDPVFDLPSTCLPPELAGEYVAALRLADGEKIVGFLLLHESSTPSLASEGERARLSTAGRLFGAALSRGVAHQSLLELTSRADAAQRMQQQILDHVSHEFNTPLMIIKSSAEFAHSGSDEERELFLDMQSQAIERLEELVQGVLEVARSGVSGTPQSLDFDQLKMAIFDPILESRGSGDGRPELWLRAPGRIICKVEPDALSLATEHVLRNAERFAVEQGGRAALAIYGDERLRWSRQRAGERLSAGLSALEGDHPFPFPEIETPDVLVVEVYDSGIGIPADELELVFEPFTQASNSPLRGVSGAGMGLPTARRLVEDHGGEMVLTSREGHGTVFSILLPLQRGD